MTSEKFVCCHCHFWTTPVFEAQRESDGRHPQSHQCSVTRQLTYLPYNYLDFFVTPVVAGTGTGGGEGIFINKQLKSATSYILFVDSIPEKWLQTSWLWSYLELTSDGWMVWDSGHISPSPPPLCPGRWVHIRWSEWVTTHPETIPDQRHVNTEQAIH